MSRMDEGMIDNILTIWDVMPVVVGDIDFIDIDNHQCCCGVYNCKDEYQHWTSGF